MKKFTIPLGLGMSLVLAACAPVANPRGAPVKVTLLGLNDFHGNLTPSAFRYPDPANPSAQLTVQAGGVEYLATLIKQTRAENPNTVVVGAGDLVGASPLASSLLADEPAIDALNRLGLEYSSVGNHEFDQGFRELLRLQNGGCDGYDPNKTCKYDNTFAGAKFRYLAANVIDKTTNRTALPASAIKTIGGVRIGFIGAVTRTTPTIVTPTGVANLDFTDEAEAINRTAAELRAQGVQALVVLIHEGGTTTAAFDQQDCQNLTGPIVDITKRLDPSIDAVISGHSHRPYQCRVDGRLVTQSGQYGNVLTRVDLTINRASGGVTRATSRALLVDSAKIAKDPDLTAVVARANSLTAELAGRAIARIGADQLTRDANPAGESVLGSVIADSQLFATRGADKGAAVIAFMNPGGIRANLPPNTPSRTVTYGDSFTVQPFGNSLTTLTLTGAQIKTLLEQQFDNPSPGANRILQVSEGFSYTWDNAKPKGSKVDAASIKLGGQTIDPAASYRVTVNSFLADGGDNFTVLREGTNRLGGGQDLDALQAFLAAQERAGTPVTATPRGRITRVN